MLPRWGYRWGEYFDFSINMPPCWGYSFFTKKLISFLILSE